MLVVGFSRLASLPLLWYYLPDKPRSHRLAVRTPGFHPGNRGSIPLGITMKKDHVTRGLFSYLNTRALKIRGDSVCLVLFFRMSGQSMLVEQRNISIFLAF